MLLPIILLITGAIIVIRSQFIYTFTDAMNHGVNQAFHSIAPYIGGDEYKRMEYKKKLSNGGLIVGVLMLIAGAILLFC